MKTDCSELKLRIRICMVSGLGHSEYDVCLFLVKMRCLFQSFDTVFGEFFKVKCPKSFCCLILNNTLLECMPRQNLLTFL